MKKTYLTVIMVLMSLLSQTAESATVNINLDTTNQTIRGFGGMNFPRWIGTLTDAQVDAAFGNGSGQIGMTILRIDVPPNTGDWSGEVSAAARAVNNHGAIVFASPWSPPASMKTNGSTTGGELKTDSYDDYADHLTDFADYMSSNGAPLYAISLQNEPDIDVSYESCDWTSTQMINFLVNNASVIPTRVMVAESFNFNQSFTNPILNNSSAEAQLEIIGGHIYGGGVADYPLAHSKGKEVWMTEHYTDSSNDADLWPNALNVGKEIHDCMAVNMNAYIWWYIRRSYGPIAEDGHVTKRGYCMSHFAKFVRPGYIRIAATPNPQSGVYVTAYKSGNTLVIVAVNQSSSSQSVTFSPSGGSVTSYTKYETSSSNNLANMGSVGSSNTLAANSINTFVGTIGGTTPDNTPPTPDPLTWSSYPEATGSSTITMTATTATDANSPPVQYYFECTNDANKDSGWQSSTTYVASGLTPSTQYSFRVKARDSYTTPNETGWSGTESATTLEPPVGPQLEIGTVLGVDSSWTDVTLSQSYSSMVVVAVANYSSTSDPVAVRIQNASGNSFQVCVDPAGGSVPSSIDVHFMVVEEGVYTVAEHGVKMEAVKYLSTVTDSDSSWNGQSRTYSNSYSNPVVLGQVMTYADPDFSVFWCRGSASGNPPDSSNLYTGKTVCEDSDTTRNDETIGYIVIEAGSGDIEGIDYVADLGSNAVQGVGDSPPYTYSISGLSSPDVAIVSLAGMNGPNGGWAILYGANPVTSTSLNLAIDEDVAGDTERNHIAEEVGYIVFGYSGTPPTYTLTVSSTSGGTVTTPGIGDFDYDDGTYASIVASANANYHFVEWTGSAVTAGKVSNPSSANTDVLMDDDYTVTANFEADTPDTTPPTPDPLVWSAFPTATGQTTITMTAATATDSESPPVQYYFECTNDGTKSSSWQSSSSYTASGLAPGTQYSFRVQARDSASTPNVTGWSSTQSATTEPSPDITPPTPDPMTWSSVPTATGQTTITMTATTATDSESPPVQYYFECTNDGTKSSTWQSSSSYTATGLTPATQYSFRVQARDSAATPNVTGWSSTESATTDPLPPDTTPPTPDPLTWSSVPAATGQTTITMTATTATDADSPPVQYYFECTNDGTKSSSWQSSASYTASGLTPATQYSFRVKARDSAAALNETGWSSTQSATTQEPGEGVEILGSWATGTSHTKESGSNRALVVIAHAEGSWWRTPTLSTVTYGGQTMTKITDIAQSSGWQTRAYVGAFILDEAGVSAASGSTISASWGGSPTSTSITSVFLGGVDQADLVGASATAGVSNSSTLSTSSLSNSSGDMVIEGATCTETGTYTANNGFTKDVDLGVSGFDGMDGHKPATGASETPSITHSTSTNRQAILGFVVNAGGPPPPEPAAPTGLSAVAGDGTVSLDWNDNSEPDLDGYNVYRSTTSGSGYSKINGSLLSSSNYTDNSVTNGTTYYYVVTAVDTDLYESAYSSEVSATPTLPGQDVEIIGSWVTGTSHTKESGSNRALIFIAHGEQGSAMNLTSVTYGGQAMTKVLDGSSSDTYAYTAAFILDEAGVAAASSSSFSVTWSGSTPGGVAYASVFLKNVNQTTLTGATGSGATTSSSTVTTSSSLATNDGDMVILAAGCGNSGSYTLNNGFTEGADQVLSNDSATGVTGHKSATGANETPSATYSSSVNRQVIIGLVVQH